jgi:hypothetical protein
MSEVDVVCYAAFDGWNCHVTVADDDGSSTEHDVSVRRDEFQRYASDGDDVKMLLDASFRFLLEREPKESILGRFTLSDIERYFPDYPRAIADRLRG